MFSALTMLPGAKATDKLVQMPSWLYYIPLWSDVAQKKNQQCIMSFLAVPVHVEVTLWRDADNSRQIRAERETGRQAEGQMEVLKRYLGRRAAGGVEVECSGGKKKVGRFEKKWRMISAEKMENAAIVFAVIVTAHPRHGVNVFFFVFLALLLHL